MLKEETFQNNSDNRSQKILQSFASEQNSSLKKHLGVLDSQNLNQIWSEFGKYIKLQLKSNKGVMIPKFGLFTFQHPTIKLDGVTNHKKEHDLVHKEPLFIISKDFCQGLELSPGIYQNGVYKQQTPVQADSKIQTQLINWVEISQILQMDNDQLKMGIQRVIKNVQYLVKQKQNNIVIQIPHVGEFIIKNGLACVKFFSFYLKNTDTSTFKRSSQSFFSKNKSSNSLSKFKSLSLYKDQLSPDTASQNLSNSNYDGFKFAQTARHINREKESSQISIEPDAKQYLQLKYGFFSDKKQQSNQQYSNEYDLLNKNELTFSRNNFFTKTSKQSTVGSINKQEIINSQENKSSKEKTDNMRRHNNYKDIDNDKTNKDELIQRFKDQLKLKKQSEEEVFKEMQFMAYGIYATKSSTLNFKQFSYAIKKLGYSFKDEEIESLYQKLDLHKDRLLEQYEFIDILKDTKAPYQIMIDIINKNRYKYNHLLLTLQIKPNDTPYTSETFARALIRLPNLSIEESTLISKFIYKENLQLSAQQLCSQIKSEFFHDENPDIYISYKNNNNKIEQEKKEDQHTNHQIPQENSNQQSDQKSKNYLGSSNNKNNNNNENDKLKDNQIHQKFNQISSVQNKKQEELNWINSKLIQIKNKLMKHLNPDFLLHECKQTDEKFTGTVEIHQLSKIFLNYQDYFCLSQLDIVRLLNNIDKEDDATIDYNKLLKTIENLYNKGENPNIIEFTAENLSNYLSQNSMSPQDFILFLSSNPNNNKNKNKLYNLEDKNQIPVDIFIKLLFHNNVLPKSKKYEVLQIKDFFDIDKDGFVDQYDIETFINRHPYLQKKQFLVPPKINNANQNKSQINSVKSSQQLKSVSSQQQQQSSSLNQNISQQQNEHLFPDIEMEEKSLEEILRQLKHALQIHRVPVHDAYYIFDEDGDGFVSFSEFKTGLDKWMKLSLEAKEGLFSYFDFLKIGMFDYKRWTNVMKRYVMDASKVKQDNWDFQTQIVQKLKKWRVDKNMSVEEVFKIMDSDFDSFVNQADLKRFLIKYLMFKAEELYDQRMDRLFKLFDTFKRGYIQKQDIQVILSEEEISDRQQLEKSASSSQIISKHNSLLSTQQQYQQNNNNSSQIDEMHSKISWYHNACQQMALKLTKKYQTIEESFEQISMHKNKIGYTLFKQYMQDNMILDGFNMTDELMQKLYAFIDPHKKGYLTLKDWLYVFSKYTSAQELPFKDIKLSLQFNFTSIEDAYKFFLSSSNGSFNYKNIDLHSDILTFQGFKKGMKSLFHTVYNDTNIQEIWQQLMIKLNKTSAATQNDKFEIDNFTLSLDEFIQVFGQINSKNNHSKHNNKNTNRNLISQQLQSSHRKNVASDLMLNNSGDFSGEKRSSSVRNFSQIPNNAKKLYFSETAPAINLIAQIIQKFKDRVLASGQNLYELFSKFELQKHKNSGIVTGSLSIMEFKNSINSLKLGMSPQDIDIIIKYFDSSNNGQIQWKNLIKRMKITESELATTQRATEKIQKLKNNLYLYMISPKDAFRIFDKNKIGYINFEEFQEFISKISELSKEPVPNFPVIKDLFEFIDMRKDNVIDIDEWLQTFIRIDVNNNNNNKAVFNDPFKNNAFNLKNNNNQQQQQQQQQFGFYQSQIKKKQQFKSSQNFFTKKKEDQYQQQFSQTQLVDEFSNFKNKQFAKNKSPKQFCQTSSQFASPRSQHNYQQNINNNKYLSTYLQKPQTSELFQLNNNLEHNLEILSAPKDSLNWEKSKDFDDAIFMIGKNRNYLLEQFQNAAQMESFQNKDQNKELKFVKYQKAKEIIQRLLDKQQIAIGDDNWFSLLGFASKKGMVNFKILLEIYKKRLDQIENHPNQQ